MNVEHDWGLEAHGEALAPLLVRVCGVPRAALARLRVQGTDHIGALVGFGKGTRALPRGMPGDDWERGPALLDFGRRLRWVGNEILLPELVQWLQTRAKPRAPAAEAST